MKASRYNIWTEGETADYVYNGVSGAMLRVAKGQREAVEQFLQGSDEGSPSVLVDLTRGRMLIPDTTDELALLERRYQASRYDADHLGFTLVTSLGCNFDCPYCFEAKHPSIMDAGVEEAILQIVDDKLPTIKSLSVNWFGGEPLVGKKPLLALSDAFIERCDRAGVLYQASITTNGYLLDEEMCIKLRDRRVNDVQVSLDGPPETHDRMRPLAGGKGSFWRIVENLRVAVDYLPIGIRMNVDTENIGRAEELLQILADQGLAGRVSVYMGQIVGISDVMAAPSASFAHACLTRPQFAEAEIQFTELATRYGFSAPSVPSPMATPCTAVRANELIIGSKGELYKCWESVGNRLDVVGDVRTYQDTDGRLRRWLNYDPFANKECQSCIALPVCMGGCAHHAMDPLQYENRCGTFRFNYRERVGQFVDFVEQAGMEGLVATARIQHSMDTR